MAISSLLIIHSLSSEVVRSEATVAGGDLRILSVDATESSRLTVRQIIHSRLGKVEAGGSVVNSQNIDGLAVVCDAVAGAALWGVPACNSLITTNARERRNVALCVPSVSGDESVRTVGARQSIQRTATVIVPSVVGDYRC